MLTTAGRSYLLFLSRIHPKKGCDLLLQAFAKIAPAHPKLHLIMAGPDAVGMRKHLQTIVDQAGLTDRVHWPGMLKGDAKWGAFAVSEAFVLPSHQENFGIAVAEALACGRPVLISDQVNIAPEIEADGCGIVEPDTLEGTSAFWSAGWLLIPRSARRCSDRPRSPSPGVTICAGTAR